MNPIMSRLAQLVILMPANLVLRLIDRAAPIAAGSLKTAGHRGDMLLCSAVVVGWWVLIVQAVQGVIGLP